MISHEKREDHGVIHSNPPMTITNTPMEATSSWEQGLGYLVRDVVTLGESTINTVDVLKGCAVTITFGAWSPPRNMTHTWRLKAMVRTK